MSSVTEAENNSSVVDSSLMFMFFPRLPQELRQLIWEFHHLPTTSTRVLSLSYGVITKQPIQACFFDQFTISTYQDHLAPVCAESKRIVEKKSEAITMAGTKNGGYGLRYRPDHDTLYLGWESINAGSSREIGKHSCGNYNRLFQALGSSSLTQSLQSFTIDLELLYRPYFRNTFERLSTCANLRCINLAIMAYLSSPRWMYKRNPENGVQGSHREAEKGTKFTLSHSFECGFTAEKRLAFLNRTRQTQAAEIDLVRQNPSCRWTTTPQIEFAVLVEGEGELKPIEVWLNCNF